MTTIIITRQELYERVWSMPITKLAQEYGITPWAIAGACERLVVPRPKCGDWMRMRYGKRVRKTPLPEEPGAPQSATLRRWRERLPRGARIEIPKVLVPVNLHGCDPLISATRRALEKEKPCPAGQHPSRRAHVHASAFGGSDRSFVRWPIRRASSSAKAAWK